MGVLNLSVKERRRVELLSRVRDGELSLVKASGLASLSYRQMKRLWVRYQELGDEGLIHRGRGKRSNRQIAPELREQMVARYQERYEDFGPTLAAEYLAGEGLRVDHETLRRWLLADGHWKKKRRRKKHRSRRERRGHRGELVQMDGSHHDWFEGRRERAVLMVMIDDATNQTYARFYEGETTSAAFDIVERYAGRCGLPQGLYVDRHSIYECTREGRIDEDLRGTGPETQFARAMRQLDVDLIAANSPQAKGRVERRNAVFQDRLVKALRLEGISTIEEANTYLEKVFLPMLNSRFTQEARESGDLHRAVPTGLHLTEVLCWQEPRVVCNDWTIRWRNRYFQIHRQHESLELPGKRIEVREKLDGQVLLFCGEQSLRFRELAGKPRKIRKSQSSGKGPWKPAADHPWRQSLRFAEAVLGERQEGSPGG